MARGYRTTVATILLAAGLAACGGEAASIQADEEARRAIVDTSVSWTELVRTFESLTGMPAGAGS